MGWQFVESQQVPTGHPFPSPTLRFQAEFRWDGATNIEISSARLTASLPDILGTAWAEMPLPIGQPEVQPHRSTYVNIALPIDRRFIELVGERPPDRAPESARVGLAGVAGRGDAQTR